MSLKELAKQFRDACAAGDLETAYNLSVQIMQKIGETWFGATKMALGADTQAGIVSDLQGAHDELSARSAGGGNKAAIGDGRILQLLLQLLPVIIGLFK